MLKLKHLDWQKKLLADAWKLVIIVLIENDIFNSNMQCKIV